MKAELLNYFRLQNKKLSNKQAIAENLKRSSTCSRRRSGSHHTADKQQQQQQQHQQQENKNSKPEPPMPLPMEEQSAFSAPEPLPPPEAEVPPPPPSSAFSPPPTSTPTATTIRPSSPTVAPPAGVRGTFSVTVDKAGMKVGLDIQRRPRGLRVRQISGGAIEKFNLERPEAAVQVSDQIIEVNGIRGDSAALLRAIAASETLTMVILRGEE